MSSQNVPELRLDGFDEQWWQIEIGRLFSERVESFPDGELLSVTSRNGIKKFSEIGRHNTSNENKTKYKKVCPGDIAYNSMRMWQGASGYSPYLGIVSPAYTVLNPETNVDSNFYSHYFKHPRVIQTFQKNSQGLTSDTWNLKFPALSSILIYSTKVQEQRAIGEVFTTLDIVIASHKKKLDLLKQTKTSLLQRMFPQDGANLPELRVDGFKDRWRNTRLGNEGAPQSGVSFPPHEQGHTLGVPFFKVSDMVRTGNEREMNSSRNLVSEPQIVANGWKPIENVPSIIFPKRGAAIFTNRKRLVKTPFLMDNNVMAFVFDSETADADFIITLFETIDLGCFVQTGSLPAFDNPQVEACEVKLPPLEEQRAIGAIFKNLDTLIAAQAQLLDKLAQTKTALLQKMFV